MDFTSDGGVLERLTLEQSGSLGGPKPDKTDVAGVDGSNLGTLAAGRLISGREVMAMLQGMNGMAPGIG